ncbi:MULTISPECIES: DUF3667 domain-containing protein [unclassified Cellulophaga]|uniref:DUF3667 domain-containing protein n=1 Tax=unclassified Cellulophaga TaxID=2634405 RepID=UPI0026E39F42|nr:MULTISPECIES: DUF3667 domain-containing protein [unclassified Cellulophaga]MDO6492339.1 DUF3667 domain-containing protein [Cellulophaga sp. 2_MG-2023]MDO6496161.1 DUF3667 domain-containing protein [Cellulophaga sp. 3_MG-2023]
MNCKNCANSLQTDYSFCPDCGAKVIRNRLTIKNLLSDITERYFNLDNTFLRTFLHLFTKPDIVINGYVNGTRRKYVNPISYFGIALMLAGFLMFFMRKVFDFEMDFDAFDQGMNPEFTKKMMDVQYDYSSLFFISYIPIFLIVGLITLNKRKHILAEYTISVIYSLAQWSILSFFTSMLMITYFPESFSNYTLLLTLFLILYFLYVQQKLNKYSTWQIIYKSVLFIVILSTIFIGTVTFIMIVAMATGHLNPADFVPSK